ncbi:MAG: hypothetical protein ISS82_00840 [Nanoarchaeota archaeon]|nr:hypothetical protein [Nanoarchaeota archaeon]
MSDQNLESMGEIEQIEFTHQDSIEEDKSMRLSFYGFPFGLDTYFNVGTQISQAGLQRPLASEIVAFFDHLKTSGRRKFCQIEEKINKQIEERIYPQGPSDWPNPNSDSLKNCIDNLYWKYLLHFNSNFSNVWCFNGVLPTSDGVIIQDDPNYQNNRIIMDEKDLTQRLGSREKNGVIYSDDGSIRFVPYGFEEGSFYHIKHPPMPRSDEGGHRLPITKEDIQGFLSPLKTKLYCNPFVIALFGEQGAMILDYIIQPSIKMMNKLDLHLYKNESPSVIKISGFGYNISVYNTNGRNECAFSFGIKRENLK